MNYKIELMDADYVFCSESLDGALENMWRWACDNDFYMGQAEFCINDVLFEGCAMLFHYRYDEGRLDLADMLAKMSMESVHSSKRVFTKEDVLERLAATECHLEWKDINRMMLCDARIKQAYDNARDNRGVRKSFEDIVYDTVCLWETGDTDIDDVDEHLMYEDFCENLENYCEGGWNK